MQNTKDERKKRKMHVPDVINILMEVRGGYSKLSIDSKESDFESWDSTATALKSDISKRTGNGFAQCPATTLRPRYLCSHPTSFAINSNIQVKLYKKTELINGKLHDRLIDYETLSSIHPHKRQKKIISMKVKLYYSVHFSTT